MHKFWSILFGAVLGVAGVISLLSPLFGWKLPENQASYGPKVDNLFHLILAITAIAFVGTEVVLVWAMWRFVGRPGAKSPYVHGNHKLEMIWTAVPAGILLFIAFAQVGAWADIKYQSRMPDPAQVFEVSARQFEWRFRYPAADQLEAMVGNWKDSGSRTAAAWERSHQFDDVHVVNEVHTWKGANVRMFLKTRDVLHSFFLPNARVKQDVVPGMEQYVWFHPTVEGTYDIVCAELCGWGHYKMRGRLTVESQEKFDKWYQDKMAEQNQASFTPVEEGSE